MHITIHYQEQSVFYFPMGLQRCNVQTTFVSAECWVTPLHDLLQAKSEVLHSFSLALQVVDHMLVN